MPVEQATTSSLEALKAYQLGLELRSHSKNIEARPAFKTAIALDPSFAIAYAQLGSSYSNEGEVQEGKKYFEKAFELRARATEPERLYIVGVISTLLRANWKRDPRRISCGPNCIPTNGSLTTRSRMMRTCWGGMTQSLMPQNRSFVFIPITTLDTSTCFSGSLR